VGLVGHPGECARARLLSDPHDRSDPRIQDFVKAWTPLGRVGEMGGWPARPSSGQPASDYVTGVTLPVDGGMTAV
jgi:NAD(P)-dependent dehydrogenase (short-subunit alcohol dehydrogenase family)